MLRLGLRSSWATQRAVPYRPCHRPPSARVSSAALNMMRLRIAFSYLPYLLGRAASQCAQSCEARSPFAGWRVSRPFWPWSGAPIFLLQLLHDFPASLLAIWREFLLVFFRSVLGQVFEDCIEAELASGFR